MYIGIGSDLLALGFAIRGKHGAVERRSSLGGVATGADVIDEFTGGIEAVVAPTGAVARGDGLDRDPCRTIVDPARACRSLVDTAARRGVGLPAAADIAIFDRRARRSAADWH